MRSVSLYATLLKTTFLPEHLVRAYSTAVDSTDNGTINKGWLFIEWSLRDNVKRSFVSVEGKEVWRETSSTESNQEEWDEDEFGDIVWQDQLYANRPMTPEEQDGFNRGDICY